MTEDIEELPPCPKTEGKIAVGEFTSEGWNISERLRRLLEVGDIFIHSADFGDQYFMKIDGQRTVIFNGISPLVEMVDELEKMKKE